MAFGPDYQNKVITDPRNHDPLHLLGSVASDGGGLFETLLGMGAATGTSPNPRDVRETREANFSPYAQPNTNLPTVEESAAERAKFAARQAARSAQDQQINEQNTEEGLLRRLIRPRNELEDALNQAPPRQR